MSYSKTNFSMLLLSIFKTIRTVQLLVQSKHANQCVQNMGLQSIYGADPSDILGAIVLII